MSTFDFPNLPNQFFVCRQQSRIIVGVGLNHIEGYSAYQDETVRLSQHDRARGSFKQEKKGI